MRDCGNLNHRANALRSVVSRELSEGPLHFALTGKYLPLNDEVSVGGHEKFVAPGFRCNKPQRCAHYAADHFVVVAPERLDVQCAEIERRVMADNDCDRGGQSLRFISTKNLPVV